MLRRLMLLTLAAGALAVPAAAHAQTGAANGGCPSFRVLNDDRIGSLSLPAGAYAITVNTPSTLSCSAAADLFSQFLEDFDGRLSGGWAVSASSATFSRSKPRAQSFSVKRTGATAPSSSTTLIQPTTGGTCPAAFDVLHDDHIGPLDVPAGRYRLNLVAAGRLTCDQAATNLARFMQDYDGRLARPWTLFAETGTFLRGSPNVGFQLEPLVGPPPSKVTLKLPGDGQPCPGTFQVLHDDHIGALPVDAGRYLFVPRAGSSLTCANLVSLMRRFLGAPHNRLPSPWRVARSTGTFTRGRGSKVAFRIKPFAS